MKERVYEGRPPHKKKKLDSSFMVGIQDLMLKTKKSGTIQDGRSITARDCSSQSKRRELEDATLSDKFWSLTEQKIPSGGTTRVTSATLVAGAEVLPAPWHSSSRSRVNRAGSSSDRGLEDPHGSPA